MSLQHEIGQKRESKSIFGCEHKYPLKIIGMLKSYDLNTSAREFRELKGKYFLWEAHLMYGK